MTCMVCELYLNKTSKKKSPREICTPSCSKSQRFSPAAQALHVWPLPASGALFLSLPSCHALPARVLVVSLIKERALIS